MYVNVFKRLLDILCSAGGLLVLLPVFVALAVAIKLGDPGPVIFRQRRTGQDGVPFTLFKFRSMPANVGDRPSDQVGTLQLTGIGSTIRRTNLDELPQLFNILLGDMSLIGPRPSLQSQTELIEARRANGALRLRPGLTGWAQVNSFDRMSLQQKAAFDGEYASRVSFGHDVYILWRTIAYLRKPPPVY